LEAAGARKEEEAAAVKIGWLLCCAALAGCGAASDPGGKAAPASNASRPAERSPERQSAAQDAEITVPPGSNTLCRAGELFIFACSLGREMVAVCGGRSPSGRGYAQYRHGVPGNLDLVYPGALDAGPGSLSSAFRGYSGGGESQIRFVNDGVEYVVYSRMTRTGFGPDGNNNNDFEGGLFVRRGTRMISNRRCVASADPQPDVNNGADATVDLSTAERYMPEGAFVEWDE
jgi:hypothetical protein